MVIVAAEQSLPPERRVVSDELAVRFLPAGMRLAARACRWRPVRELLIAATDKKARGIWGGVLCRKRYADEKVSEAVDAGIRQVVLLGAGFDTRACRLVVPRGAAAYEVDLPANIADKRRVLRTVYGRVPEHLALVPVDFETDDLAAALATAGFDPGRPALFVWEAVTQYLTEEAVRATLTFLAKAAAGSRLIFTYVRKDFLDGADLYGAEGAYQEFVVKQPVWRFGIAPEDVGGLLRPYGWVEREQVGHEAYAAGYLQPTGRELRVSEIERFVYADRP